VGSLTADSFLASPLTSDEYGATFRYDVEKEVFSVSVNPEASGVRVSLNQAAELWTDASAWSHGTHDSLVFSSRVLKEVKWQFRMPRAQAQAFSWRARVVMVYKLAPFLQRGLIPVLWDDSTNELPVRPEQLWVISLETGEVYQKFHIDSGAIESAGEPVSSRSRGSRKGR
jgi:hypothetical protein